MSEREPEEPTFVGPFPCTACGERFRWPMSTLRAALAHHGLVVVTRELVEGCRAALLLLDDRLARERRTSGFIRRVRDLLRSALP